MTGDVSLSDIRAAAERIRGIAHRTQVFTSRTFDALAGAQVYFKCENFQRGGAFKIRGASNFIYSIPKDQLRRGVVTYSSGNHAQAVAIAAASVGIQATIVMPDDAPKSKLEATRGYGAQVVTYDRLTGNREAIGKRISEETGATVVPPYDHPWIIAGQGTAALELLEEIPDLDALVVCIGGGGLDVWLLHHAAKDASSRRFASSESSRKTATTHIFRSAPDRELRFQPLRPSPTGCARKSPARLLFPLFRKTLKTSSWSLTMKFATR